LRRFWLAIRHPGLTNAASPRGFGILVRQNLWVGSRESLLLGNAIEGMRAENLLVTVSLGPGHMMAQFSPDTLTSKALEHN
jgi:hypothetical protein